MSATIILYRNLDILDSAEKREPFLSCMQNITYWLANVEDRVDTHASFYIPDEKDRQTIKPGVFVKVIFEFSPETQGNCGERLWVKFMGRGDNGFSGILMNKPTYIPLAIGDWITFGPEHIAGIVHDPDESD